MIFLVNSNSDHSDTTEPESSALVFWFSFDKYVCQMDKCNVISFSCMHTCTYAQQRLIHYVTQTSSGVSHKSGLLWFFLFIINSFKEQVPNIFSVGKRN